MPIYFYQTNQQLPLSLESIGNDWAQDDVARPDGYPYFHWLLETIEEKLNQG